MYKIDHETDHGLWYEYHESWYEVIWQTYLGALFMSLMALYFLVAAPFFAIRSAWHQWANKGTYVKRSGQGFSRSKVEPTNEQTV